MNTRTVYLIVGASSDIGMALLTNILAAEEGALCFAHYCSSPKDIYDLALGAKNEVVPLQADLTEPAQVLQLVDAVKARCDAPTNIVYLPAAKMIHSRFRELDWNRFMGDFEIQVHALTEICKAFLPVMAKRKAYNKVIFVLSSVTEGVPPKFLTPYVMVKYAQLGLMRALASEYAAAQVSISAVSPSMVETKFLSEVDQRLLELMRTDVPGGSFLTVAEVASVIFQLFAKNSNELQGQNIVIAEDGSYGQ